jgi:hypothetical protein
VPLVALLATGCAPSARASDELRDDAAIREAALTELFLVRERARSMVFWVDSVHAGPVFDSLRLPAGPVVPAPVAPAPLPSAQVTLADMQALFRDHPDGWAAFFARHPGAPGLVEVGPVERDMDGRRARVAIGRSCGEHCRMAWRVELALETTGGWRIVSVGRISPS